MTVDMHRGHLDPEVATLPAPKENCANVIRNARRWMPKLPGSSCEYFGLSCHKGNFLKSTLLLVVTQMSLVRKFVGR